MARLLVAGGINEPSNSDDPADRRNIGEVQERFAEALGKNIILRRHTLLGACRTRLDAIVAEAAARTAADEGLIVNSFIRSWVTDSTERSHAHGQLTRSQLNDWGQIPRGFAFPEPVQEADAIIIIGGWDGTHHAASWGRLANKPLLPVASFGGAAADIYRDELAVFERRYVTSIPRDDYEMLNQILPDESEPAIDAHAIELLKLAERTILSSDVFVVMPFDDRPHLRDAYNTFRRVCDDKNFSAVKVDHDLDNQQRIVPAIFSGIKRAAFVIAEVSGARPNVYYELGYARALGKPVIQTAFEGTELPFDVYDVPTLFWECQDTLERKLTSAIDQLTSAPGHRVCSE